MTLMYALICPLFCCLATIIFASEQRSDFLTKKSIDSLKYLEAHSQAEYQLTFQTLTKIEKHFDKASKMQALDHALIPKNIHFIWIGPNHFSKSYITNIESWHRYNPDYEITLWTDRTRHLPLAFVTLADVNTLNLKLKGKECFSFAEKADLLRYEILEQCGGIYADVDTECHRSFDPLINTYAFFAGIEDIASMVQGRHLRVANAIFGSVAHHPILQKTIQHIAENWQKNTDRLYRLSAQWELEDYIKFLSPFIRTNLPFTSCIFETPLEERDILLPPSFLGLTYYDDEVGLYCTHHFAASWTPKMLFVSSSETTENVHKLLQVNKNVLQKTLSGSTKILTFGILNLLISLFALGILLVVLRLRKKRPL